VRINDIHLPLIWTIPQKSYRDAIRLLFDYISEYHATKPTQVTVEQVNSGLVRSFLTHLEEKRGNTISTRNQRLAALQSLFRFTGGHVPELVEHAAQIKAIPMRRTPQPTTAYLEKDEMDCLLDVPDRKRPQGRRDYALLLFLYNTGARATEAAQVTPSDLSLDTVPSVRFFGKGRKVRLCPLWPHTVQVLRELLGPRLDGPQDTPVFLNVHRRPMTRSGIYTLIVRLVKNAIETMPSLGKKIVSPHTIRGTTAVHLLRSGVDINTIRSWLGHVSVDTTNIYAEVDLETKAKALETCTVKGPKSKPIWKKDGDLMAFLESL
jgi:site-specific recombinase XerD